MTSLRSLLRLSVAFAALATGDFARVGSSRRDTRGDAVLGSIDAANIFLSALGTDALHYRVRKCSGSESALFAVGDFFYFEGNAKERAFVTKFDLSGNAVWSRLFSGEDVSYRGTAVVEDAFGFVFAAGNAVHSSGMTEGWLTMLDPNGAIMWTKRMPTGNPGVTEVATRQHGTVLVAGTMPLDNQSGLNAFVAAYTTAGDLLWAEKFGGRVLNVTTTGLAAGDDGSALLVGNINSKAAVDNNSSSNGTFIVKYSNAGNFLWWKEATMGWEDKPAGVGAGKDGTFWVMGSAVISGNRSSFVSVHNSSSGNVIYATRFLLKTGVQERAVSVSDAGSVAVAGTYQKSSGAGLDGFVSLLDTNGTMVWSRPLWTPAENCAMHISVSRDGTSFVLAIVDPNTRKSYGLILDTDVEQIGERKRVSHGRTNHLDVPDETHDLFESVRS